MKICPTCKANYDDETRFCPADGTLLLTDFDVVHPGKVLHRQYEVEREISREGGWTVYEGTVAATKQKISIRVMPLSALGDGSHLEKYTERLNVLQKKAYPGLIRILHFGILENSFFHVITEGVEGQRLEKLMEDVGTFSVSLSLTIMEQCLAILRFLHEIGLLHATLTPAKIFLHQSLDRHFIKVDATDFYLGENVPDGYTAPELFYGHKPGVQSDVYSAGAILYKMLTGLSPYPREVFLARPGSDFPVAVPVHRTEREKVSRKLSKIVHNAIQWRPPQRFPNIASFAQALSGVKPARSYKKIWIAIVLVVLLYIVPRTFYFQIQSALRNLVGGERPSSQEGPDLRKLPQNYYAGKIQEALSEYQKELATIRPRQFPRRADLLFEVDGSCGPNLDVGDIPEQLRDEFAGNHRRLSPNATVMGAVSGREWLVRDPGQSREYLLVREEATVSVYLHAMREIKGGKVSNPQDDDPETILPFYVDCTEVTNEQYRLFTEETGHVPPPYWSGAHCPVSQENYPVVEVTWYDAALYAAWAGKKLPTESQWELAARGESSARWPWGDEWKKCANLKSDCMLPAGQFGKEWSEEWKCPRGVVDMAGNVWEWTDTWYDSLLHEDRVIKGGSFLSDYDQAAITYRDGFFPASRRRDIGFRCIIQD